MRRWALDLRLTLRARQALYAGVPKRGQVQAARLKMGGREQLLTKNGGKKRVATSQPEVFQHQQPLGGLGSVGRPVPKERWRTSAAGHEAWAPARFRFHWGRGRGAFRIVGLGTPRPWTLVTRSRRRQVTAKAHDMAV